MEIGYLVCTTNAFLTRLSLSDIGIGIQSVSNSIDIHVETVSYKQVSIQLVIIFTNRDFIIKWKIKKLIIYIYISGYLIKYWKYLLQTINHEF